MRRLFLAGMTCLALGFACAGNQPVQSPAPGPCDQVVYGACVIYTDGAPYISQERFRKAFEFAAKYWDGDVYATEGWTLLVRGRDAYMLDVLVWGVALPSLKRFEFATPNATCPEIIFVHEWGHAGAVIHNHDDLRFADGAIVAALHDAGIDGC